MTELFPYWRIFLNGFWITIVVTILGGILALSVGMIAGLGELSVHRSLRWLAYAFVEFFRGLPLLVLLFWMFFALPFFGIRLTAMTAAVLSVGLNEGAYAAEIVRASIASRPRGQDEACTALGMGRALRLRRILIPQSIPVMLPSLGNVMIDLAKATSLVSLVTVSELAFQAQIIRNTTGQTTAVYLVVLVLYFILSSVIALISRWAERRFALDPSPRAVRGDANRLGKVSIDA